MTITLTNSKYSAKINSHGAELFSFKAFQNDQEYIWDGNPNYWAKHAPILFPIVGTLKNNTYYHNEKEYHLLRHGFARDMNFEVAHCSKTKVIFILKSNDETRDLYPFDFELQLIYTLIENKILLNYQVINCDSQSIPFSIGAHPAFALNEPFENYSLAFNRQETLASSILENDLISNRSLEIELQNKILPLHYSLFENDALVFKTIHSREITILKENYPYVRITFEDFNNLGVWTKVGAPFICIEPWLGYADSIDATGNLFEKEGILTLNKNETFEAQFSIEIL
jgi:galactose mutarotase-like enzyme